MNILKQLKSGKIGSTNAAPGLQRTEEPRINYKDGKVILEADPVIPQPIETDADKKMNDAKNSQQPLVLRVMEMHEYVFDMHSILLVIANEIVKNPALIGSVLKHKD